MVCPRCGHIFVLIQFNHDNEKLALYHDKTGRAYTYSQAELDKREIDAQRKDKTFRAEDWRPKEKDARKFLNVFGTFLDQKEKRLHPGTLHIYKSYYNNHFQPLYDLDVRVIQMKHLQAWYDGLPANLSGKYKQNMTHCLRAFFNWLVRWGDRKDCPVMPEIDPADSTPRSALEYETQKEQLEKIPEPHRDFIEFLMEGGFRPAEGCALQVGDFNPLQGKILVQRGYSRNRLIPTTKGNRKDWRTLSDRACELIAQAIGNETDPKRFIFINPVTGRGYLPEFTRRLWRSNTTVSEDLYSSTRHSLATQLGEDGVPKKYIQEIMGHKDGRSTDVYIHPSDHRKKEYLNSRGKVIDIRKKTISG